MKIETDKSGRRVYKFSSSIVQGGYLYSHKTKEQDFPPANPPAAT